MASFGAIALILISNPASGETGHALRGAFASMRPASHPFVAHGFRHHRRNTFVPGFVDGYYGPDIGYGPDGGPIAGVTPPSGDVHYSYTYDVPWDWVHRYPPSLTETGRPYVSSCTAEAVVVPGRGGDQTINVIRCY